MRRSPLLILAFAAAALLPAPAPASAQAPRGAYASCEPVAGASIVQVSGAPCPEAQAAATALVAAPTDGEGDALRAAGWAPLRALVAPGDAEHDIVATRGRAALRIRRGGAPPDLDGWAAGRELLFGRPTLVPGGRVPSGAVLCTSAFLVRLPGGSLGGLSAAHCGGTRSDGTVQRRNVALRRPPQPGVVLGRVARDLERTRPLDALVVPVDTTAGRTATAVVDRGIARPPWSIAGNARPLRGRPICFSGRTSGIDQCGRIARRRRPRLRAGHPPPRRHHRPLHDDPRPRGRQRLGRLHRAARRRQRPRDRDRRHRRRHRRADVLHAAAAGARRARRDGRHDGLTG